jgi:4-aminobutyrate aminotransferase-like enzyme
MVWVEALGANILDSDGEIYLDLASGFGAASIGHRHPRVVEAITRQAGSLLHGLGDVATHPERVALAGELAALAPFPDAQVYFAVSGSDAVEIALKTALLATGRKRVLAFEGAYHGMTLGSLAATSRAHFRAPFAGRWSDWVVRARYGAEPSDVAALAADCGAILVEPLLGREGVVLPPAGWLAELRSVASRVGALLIVDEIFTGFGRTGERFAVAHDRVVPDALVVGKALGGGLPLAAVLAPRTLMESWDRGGEALHTATFLAHPLACAAARAALRVLEEESLVERAARAGRAVAARAHAWRGAEAVVDVRGRGLVWGIEARTGAAARTLQERLLARGLFALRGGREGAVVQIAPPLSITDRQLDYLLTALDAALELAPPGMP